MCGICGILNFDRANKVNRDLVGKICRSLVHRGPDDEGFYFKDNIGLGHRRLAIIDLIAGHQPMSNEDNLIWIVQNGEIYNYLELTHLLKAKGHRFKTQNDTEVILHLYEEFREDCVKYLNGMFAFAIWDSRNNLLFAARDRIGIKPFYYYFDKDRFIFASEIKAIIEDQTIPRLANYNAIAQYLRHSHSINDETFLKGIKKLLPAHFMLIKNGTLKILRYWQPPSEGFQELSEDEAVDKLRQLLDDAVSVHLRSDVSVGAHLSGGLDSGTVAALAQRHLNGRIKSFSVAFDNIPQQDEKPYITITSKYLNTEHYEFIPTAKECLSAIPKIVQAMDEPQAGSGILGHYFLCQLISRNVKVALGGQGGDELFGGYYRYLPILFSETLKSRNLMALKQIRWIFAYIANIGLFNTWGKIRRRRGLLWLTTTEFENAFGKDIPVGSGPLWDIQYYLPALLQMEDRTSMAFSIESRVPLLDYRLVEFAFGLSLETKIKNGQLKYLFRKAIKDLLPQCIIARKDKLGFPNPINRWFKNEMRPFVEETLRSKRTGDRGIFKQSFVDNLLKLHMAGRRNFSEQLWMLLNVELWFREFIDKQRQKKVY